MLLAIVAHNLSSNQRRSILCILCVLQREQYPTLGELPVTNSEYTRPRTGHG